MLTWFTKEWFYFVGYSSDSFQSNVLFCLFIFPGEGMLSQWACIWPGMVQGCQCGARASAVSWNSFLRPHPECL